MTLRSPLTRTNRSAKEVIHVNPYFLAPASIQLQGIIVCKLLFVNLSVRLLLCCCDLITETVLSDS